MAIQRLLVVDDDDDMRSMMTQYLRKSGYMVMAAATGRDVKAHLEKGRIDLVLLDVMLGDENGVQICANLRNTHDVPIILVSALSADHQRMQGYEVGADDYIAKPFNPDLLLARIRAVLRRGQRSASLNYRRNTSQYFFSGWQYDGKRDEVQSPSGFQVVLSRRETALLKVLLANPHIPLTRDEILSAMDVAKDIENEPSDVSGRALDVLVGRLRQKIEDNPKEPQLLKTERGVGYIFATDVDRTSA